jgi:predicted HTH transcriptional regulator
MSSEAEMLDQIAQGEGQQQEFKRLIDNTESIAGEIVAMANTDGGRLYIGVEDDGTIVGCPDPAQELGFERRDFPQYDLNALGEGVVNAIAHRDYSLSGSQIRVFIFSDRLEIRSPGRLPNSVTLENIKLGVHAERNRRIATLLTHLGYMSAIGTGIPRLIIRLTRQLSGREPEYSLVGEELRLCVWAAETPSSGV